ncbi:MAG: hypothetical protein HUU55_24035 [Myxococcales bacterium]|nr:hypothetical protein [Myxococcales bacterium]
MKFVTTIVRILMLIAVSSNGLSCQPESDDGKQSAGQDQNEFTCEGAEISELTLNPVSPESKTFGVQVNVTLPNDVPPETFVVEVRWNSGQPVGAEWNTGGYYRAEIPADGIQLGYQSIDAFLYCADAPGAPTALDSAKLEFVVVE